MIDNKKILKNTIFLYLRMFFLLALGLWTSRLLLEALGIDNFGIYNIVGSVMVMFSFLNNALTGSTRRFINVYIGKKNYTQLKTVFSTSLYTHLLLSLIILFIGETLGLWFMNHELNIPPNRMYAANWVYQLSVIGTCIGIISSPYEGAIIAHEKMSVFAYISILEAVFKIIILVYLIFDKTRDTLILYASLFFISNLFIFFIKWWYSIRHFNHCFTAPHRNKEIFKSFCSFSGWSTFGQIALISSTTGVNMLVNIFFGVAYNAAVGIARQLSGTVYNFITNFQTAFNPQLIQSYSDGDIISHKNLISKATRISFILMITISLPVILNMQYLLSLWLINIPPLTSIFSQLIIASSFIEALSTPLWISMQAAGNIRTYQLIISSFHILTLAASYLLLKLGLPVWCVFAVQLFVQLMIYGFRIIYVLPKTSYQYSHYIKEVLVPIILSSLIFVLFELPPEWLITNDLFKLIAQSLLSIFAALLCIKVTITTKTEVRGIHNYIQSKFNYQR